MPALITWWTQDCATLAPAAPPHAVQSAGTTLLRSWTSPGRRYHTTQHLVELFWALEDLWTAAEITDREAALARIAGWYHDAVYDPRAEPGANESASAALARDTLPPLAIAADDAAMIDRLIRLTTDHAAQTAGALEQAFHDADLWILGTETARFDQYCAQVRQEYAHMPEPAYRAGRSTILRPLLDRPTVYATSYARRTWERDARRNLARELSRLA